MCSSDLVGGVVSSGDGRTVEKPAVRGNKPQPVSVKPQQGKGDARPRSVPSSESAATSSQPATLEDLQRKFGKKK